MNIPVIVIGITCIAASVFILLLWHLSKPGRTVYLDKGKHSKVFRSKKHKLAAKPDRLESDGIGRVIPHEFKSRSGRVSNRDITQVKVATIAVRENGFKVRKAKIEYGNGKVHEFDVPSTEALMDGELGHLVRLARSVKKGQEPEAKPASYKCRYCPYREACRFAV